jgi:hypothetical protein
MNDNRRLIAWQGWKLEIPHRWDPVKLEGDAAEGYALFADTLRPRLGLRWQTLKKKSDPAKAVQLAMKNEVGTLAAEEARLIAPDNESWKSQHLFIEPDPPGRDVYSVYSQVSNRLLQVAYHAHRREHILASVILPTLADLPLDRAAQWSIFDLNCIIPAGMKLQSHRLNAGDLGLTFADRFNQVTIRQIAVAELALQRQSLDAWIIDQQKSTRRYHAPSEIFSDTTIEVNQQDFPARRTHSKKRLRYALLTAQPRTFTTLGLHDPARDRLILLHGSDESLLRVIATSVGALK